MESISTPVSLEARARYILVSFRAKKLLNNMLDTHILDTKACSKCLSNIKNTLR